ncbi:MAG: response regulator [Lachnospiraceae bacterium]|nr:response regulator [Lachnospiraceae bacterium]
MEKKVMLIGDSKSFMVNAIVKGVDKEGYQVDTVRPEINDISECVKKTGIVLLYLDTKGEDVSELLVYLRDLIVEKELYFGIIGNHGELEDALKIIPKEFVFYAFERPLNVKDLVVELDRVVLKGNERESKKKILIIDDDPTMLKNIKLLLSDKYNVYMANSGMNGITFLAKNEVDLILLDYEMPVVSGPKVLEMIKSEPQSEKIPVMFLTGKGDKDSVMTAVALKPEKYLLKTMPPAELIKNIDDFFEMKKAKSI